MTPLVCAMEMVEYLKNVFKEHIQEEGAKSKDILIKDGFLPRVTTEDEKRRPFLYRYVINIPEAGKFTFMDGGCLDEVTKQKLSGKITDEEYKRKIESVKRFERQLSDNGYLVIKFFFHIDECICIA